MKDMSTLSSNLTISIVGHTNVVNIMNYHFCNNLIADECDNMYHYQDVKLMRLVYFKMMKLLYSTVYISEDTIYNTLIYYLCNPKTYITD